MTTIGLSDLETLALGLVALVVASAIARSVPLLARLNVPTPVVGGVLVAIVGGIAAMDSVALRHGPSPKAFLLITLAGSFFVDLANASS